MAFSLGNVQEFFPLIHLQYLCVNPCVFTTSVPTTRTQQAIPFLHRRNLSSIIPLCGAQGGEACSRCRPSCPTIHPKTSTFFRSGTLHPNCSASHCLCGRQSTSAAAQPATCSRKHVWPWPHRRPRQNGPFYPFPRRTTCSTLRPVRSVSALRLPGATCRSAASVSLIFASPRDHCATTSGNR